ncbi:MAG: hypothetical protein ACW99G_01715 [Candidatus Thorarchaeota archaeon]|jgi:hypothetical protein
MPGKSGLAAYTNAFLDADINEKQRILELLRGTSDVMRGATAVQSGRQDIALKGAAETRTQGLFPDVKRTGAATATQQEAGAAEAMRLEGNAAEKDRLQREAFGMLVNQLKEHIQGRDLVQAGKTLDVLDRLNFAEERALTTISQTEQAGAEAELGTQRADQLTDQGVPRIEAQAARETAIAGREGARVEAVTSGARLTEDVPGKTAKAEAAQATAITAKAQLQELLDVDRVNSDYVDIVREAEDNVNALRDDTAWWTLKKMMAEATSPASRAPSELEMLRLYLGPEEFGRFLIDKNYSKAGYYDTSSDYMQKIFTAINSMEQLTTQALLGKEVDDIVVRLIESNPEAAAWLGTSGDEINVDNIRRNFIEYIGVQKRLLKQKWGIDYDQQVLAGRAQQSYIPGDVEQAIAFAEQNSVTPGPIGQMLKGYQPLGVKKNDVTGVILKIMNDPQIHPMFWEWTLNQFENEDPVNRPGEPALTELWGEDVYRSAQAIMRAAQYRNSQAMERSPNQPIVPTLQAPAGVAQ